jgi:hypothetical protein
MGWLGDGIRIFDMCQPITLSCHKDGKFWPEAAHAFVQGVQKNCTLTELELSSLPKMVHYAYLRTIVTRFISIVRSSETQFVIKSPLELVDRRNNYEKDILLSNKNLNWAKGELPSREIPVGVMPPLSRFNNIGNQFYNNPLLRLPHNRGNQFYNPLLWLTTQSYKAVKKPSQKIPQKPSNNIFPFVPRTQPNINSNLRRAVKYLIR